MSSDPVIEARGLGKAYPIYRRPEDRLKQLLWGRRRRYYEEFWAVREVNLRVGRGETVGIIGRNGSGKSTLLQMICGTLRPSAGEVRVVGRVAAMLELGSGFNPEFTGRENVRLAAAVLGLSREEIEARFGAIAGFADIGTFMDQPLKYYSSGMHARLAFAVCANVDADVLIVDEVLSVGDAAFQQKCMRFLNRFRLHGTMLFVSHDSGAIVKLCDRALWLEQGVVRGFGDAKEMCRVYLAAQAEEVADDRGRFQISNRTEPPIMEAMSESPAAPTTGPSGVLDFDPEEDWEESDAGAIESVALLTTDGTPVPVAKGGEEIELQIACRAGRRIGHPVVAFAWRDRLGQVLFSDDTLVSHGDGLNVEEGSTFIASFTFRLPYLSSGPYSVEAFLFESTNSGFLPIVRRRDCLILHVQSRHIFQQGLVNVGMMSVWLRNRSHDLRWGQHSLTLDEVIPDSETKSGAMISDGIARLCVTGMRG
jgi:lipopolysaccharide transport system ATP-binding protein